jgi:putative methyltransferase
VDGFDNVRNNGLLYILAYELLLGPNKCIRGGGALKRLLGKKEAALRSALSQVQQSETCPSVGVSFPRYVRVNTLLSDLEKVVSSLKSQHKLLHVDAHVPDLLVLPPATSLHEHKLVKSGMVVLQDKSSCFSALCLIHGNNQLLEGDYLDACAAPGNKTSHLAALIAQQSQTHGKVFALDRSSTRCALLQRRMEQLVPPKHSSVVTQHLDFLKTDPCDYSNVRGILLDPSCSGSGIFTSPDRQAEETDPSRMESLSNFQLVVLKHAMSFPHVQRIVYSTCSLHEQENEGVVLEALKANPDWQLVAPACLEHWKRRGHTVAGLTEKQAQCLIRADRGDETNGFFVAYFERKSTRRVETDSLEKMLKIVQPKGIAVYNGEFATTTTTTLTTNVKEGDRKVTGETCMEDQGRSETLGAPTVAKSEKYKQKSHASSKEKAIGRKRAKKLSWKQKQMEQKIRRIEKRKGNDSTGTDDA